MSFSRRVLHMDPCPWPAPSKAADATGYPLPHVLRQRHTSLRLVILVHAPRVPVPTGTDPKIKPGMGERNHRLGLLDLSSRDGGSRGQAVGSRVT
jgi:hypothetical protein